MEKLTSKTIEESEKELVDMLSSEFKYTLKNEPCPNLRSLVKAVAILVNREHNLLVETYEVLSKGL